jgi:thiol-disulfide isomerase/thioredoxin
MVALFVPTRVGADDAAPPEPLAVGDMAPALDIAHYVSGVATDEEADSGADPVTSFEAGHVYVLTFWGTWCEPSVLNLPRLGALQRKYAARKVTILAVSDEPLPTVVRFLLASSGEAGARRDHPFGLLLTTDPDKSTHRAYYEAARLDGMPATFVIGKQGRVEWIGHPMAVAPVLDAIVTGRFDRARFERSAQEAEERAARRSVLQGMLDAAEEAKDWSRYVGLLDGALSQDPEAKGLALLRFQHYLFRGEDLKHAYVLGHSLVQRARDDAQLLNEIAWTVLEDAPPERRDATFALKAAMRANALTASTDPAILDTLARAHFERGAVRMAVTWQERAVAQAGNDETLLAPLEEALARYRKVLAASAPKEEAK